MFIAVDENNERIRPIKNADAFCPLCRKTVVAKIGRIVTAHWAHKGRTKCKHGGGMTEWHYRWIDRYYGKPGWDVECIDGDLRYDCFNRERHLVYEIQKKPEFDYIFNKTLSVLNKCLYISWILHPGMFSNMEDDGEYLRTNSRRRRAILEILQHFANDTRVRFFIDSSAVKEKANIAERMLMLVPNSEHRYRYTNYCNVKYIQCDWGESL